MGKSDTSIFHPLTLAILTVSDRRTHEDDTSGDLLKNLATEAGHQVVERKLLPNNRYQLRACVSQWIAGNEVQVVLINGGTGFSEGNSTVEALQPLFDREVPGFGELFRQLSYQQLGSSALQSGAIGGLANQTLVIAVPGSGNACELAWHELIQPQLDSRTRPCSFYSHLKPVEAQRETNLCKN
ncbi:molybdenum cofactor biosynthesis protein B [Marinobacter persicus]|jgi:molybdenum cofactor biosynthesis protein B|uniref:Molybdenum cofactor biosynthesis protein B n=1 Tax=Marinobacter persicus TaxID=930118 RepID=A0A2S6G5P7_9GAMM|nr:molybdenum cofactor biosynthesis protein B [Marinobacter persicus]PPK50367.1 molybdenum cofactor biosynthesis protein B [Marinobacter persicus]PPK54449.1 molybdenum cofactor biosynthesis protein B [Marinobacter persicus]PPK57592.1 molybdenum cofactor biosynthesis protein B [Marinobacter persicus]